MDLSLQAAHEFWRTFPQSDVYQVLVTLEATENHAEEDDPMRASLAVTVDTIESLDGEDLESKLDPRTLLEQLDRLSLTRALRLLYLLDENAPGQAAEVLFYCEQNTDFPPARRFLKRNLLFERHRLGMRVLSDERRQQIQQALNTS